MNKIQPVLTFALTQIKRLFRDKVALFFTFLFPLIFLLVFGTINNNTNISFNIAILNHSETEFAENFVEQLSDNETFDIDGVSDLDRAKTMMSRGELDSIVKIPQEFGQLNEQFLPSGELLIYYDESRPQPGQTVAAIIDSIFGEINSELIGAAPLSVSQLPTAEAGLSSFDFTFAGLLAMTVMTMSIFGLANQFPAEKKSGAMRRVQATPLRPWQIIIGTIFAYSILTIMSVGVMMAAGVIFFDFQMRGDWLTLSALVLLGVFVMGGFGAIISGWSRNENQSSVISQLVAFPMMFLSGIFFPRFLMPDWLQAVTNWIPLTPVGDGLRHIIAEGANLVDIAPQIGLLALWGVVAYFIAFKVFRWD